MKTAIIIPYFGKWPVWIEFYFFSCASNKSIDWHFFTDCEIPLKTNNNMFFYSLQFDEYCQLVRERLNIPFYPVNPYKGCGLRPFYGYIHYDLLSSYDFWGWGDIDVIWGNISNFYTESLLTKFDIFSTHADRLSGHLTLIRNSEYYRQICFNIKEWEKKLIDPNPIPLDEQDLTWLLFPESRFITKFYSKVIRKIFNWRDAWVLYYHSMSILNFILGTRKRKLFFKERHTTPILGDDGLTFKYDTDLWFYKDGKIINSKTGKENIYLHFMIYKKNSFRNDYLWKENFYHISSCYNFNNGIKISKTGFDLL